jgi:hypothetical protein
MTPEDPDSLWRNRFIAVNMMRIGATVVVLFGLAVWHSDLVVKGGHWIGMPIAIIALVVSFAGPIYLSRRWGRPDGR